jgi:uncharacterized protein (TIGR02594 family)
MTRLPSAFTWLAYETGPRMLLAGLALYGTREKQGTANNPEILEWAREVGVRYRSDSVAWCGLFTAICAKRAGWPVVKDPLLARSWLNFGVPVKNPELGDVVVFWRGKRTGFQGHVGIYIGETRGVFGSYAILGGNQGDAVSIAWLSKARFLGARRPIWEIAEPTNRRRVFLTSSGKISTNEAGND